MKIFEVECVGETQIHARIKRFDGLYYNVSTKKFENNPNLKFKLMRGNGLDLFVWKPENPIEKTLEDFPFGNYIIYYYNDLKVCNYVYVDINEENVAMRIAGIRTVDGDLRTTLNKLSKQMNEVISILKVLKL